MLALNALTTHYLPCHSAATPPRDSSCRTPSATCPYSSNPSRSSVRPRFISQYTVGFVLTSVLGTWSTLSITPYILYGMVNAVLAVKSGPGQPLVTPGDDQWLIVQLPYGQALSPTSHAAVPAGEYEISLRRQGKHSTIGSRALLTRSNRP